MSARRIFLFDIDGTLITSGGAGSGAMRTAFTALWRVDDGFAGVEFSGRTDRRIFRDAFDATQVEDDFDASLRRFKRAYFRRLPASLEACEGRVLPGVIPFLETLTADDSAVVGLGTGNFRAGAMTKLGYYGIDHYFAFGGFGDASEDRASLIASAIRAGRRRAGKATDVFVLGDTPHDITAAKANNVVAVGVATGTSSVEDLSRAGADIVLESMQDAAKHLLK